MLTLLLTAHDGGTAWRHLLAEGEARAGFEPVGPLGLVRRLGRILGVPVEAATLADRLAAWTQRLAAHDDRPRSYSASRRTDPTGVSRHLLSLRDRLRLQGWDGRPLTGSARLSDLSDLERSGPPLPPGPPDLIADLVAALREPGALPFPVRVTLTVPRGDLDPLVRTLLEAMAAAGAEVIEPPTPAPLAPADSDLGRVQGALLDPAARGVRLAGDGSFLILEADTPLEAAELTASLARTGPLARATFVVPTESATLDGALARQGLPTLGVAASSHLRPHLQVLPLRLALAFKPQDPFRAAELLLLPGGPLPRHAQRRLLEALQEMPGLGSPAWVEAVADASEGAVELARAAGDDEARAAEAGVNLRAAIDDWFGGDLHDPREGVPAAQAARLCALVAAWAGGRVQGASEQAEVDPEGDASDDASLWGQAVAVARSLERLLVAEPPGARLAERALLQLHATAVGNGSSLGAFDGESGRPALAALPASVTTPCDEVVWWGFVLDGDPGPAPEPWTDAERAGLAAAGVQLPAPGDLRAVEAAGWRRPILAARERAVLVRWRLAGAEPVAPHALLDELTPRLAGGALTACTLASERLLGGGRARHWPVAAMEVRPADLMAQRAAWKVPAATLAPKATLSASALELYLGCPFRWALKYQARLSPGHGVDLPADGRLLGGFAHRILQSMLCGPEKLPFPAATRAEAVDWAERAFDARVGLEAAPLVRPGAEVELARARSLVSDAAGALLELLKGSGWAPVEAELEVKGTFAGRPASGYVDLVVARDGALALVDLKLSGLRYRREELEAGHALQPALYASMLKQGGRRLPPSGFFILEDGQLLTTEGQSFPGSIEVAGPTPRETLAAAEAGFAYWTKVLGAGVLPVLHEKLPWEGPVTAAAGPPPEKGTPARRGPPCRFCEFTAICVPPAIEDEDGVEEDAS